MAIGSNSGRKWICWWESIWVIWNPSTDSKASIWAQNSSLIAFFTSWLRDRLAEYFCLKFPSFSTISEQDIMERGLPRVRHRWIPPLLPIIIPPSCLQMLHAISTSGHNRHVWNHSLLERFSDGLINLFIAAIVISIDNYLLHTFIQFWRFTTLFCLLLLMLPMFE